jgi:hypothetical protein
MLQFLLPKKFPSSPLAVQRHDQHQAAKMAAQHLCIERATK